VKTYIEGDDDGTDARALALVRQGPPWKFLRAGLVGLGVLSVLWVLIESAELSAAPIREVAWLLAALPPAVFVPLVLWLDRYEAEPRWLLSVVFLWGAFGAALASAVVNGLVQAAVPGGAGLGVSAPVVEELTKGAALWLLVRYRRDEFDGVLDGVVYATMVALGFAMTENVLYYGRAALGRLEGASLGAVFVARGIVTPLAHPLFTALTGVGIGLGLGLASGALRLLAGVGGLAAAVGLHALWNRTAQTGALPAAYVTVFAPTLAVLVVIALLARRRERRVVADELGPERAGGVLSPAEYEELVRARPRRRRLRRALLRGGVTAWSRVFRFYDLATELAFRKRRGVPARELEPYRAALRLARQAIPPSL
jgi:RsiW-degrading membrane proteinase PrsW (M82 family)